MTSIPPTILVIFGITGDLSRRKLLPALQNLHRSGYLPADFQLIGITRRPDITPDSLLGASPNLSFLKNRLELISFDTADFSGYQKLYRRLSEIDRTGSAVFQKLFYLSVPPSALPAIIRSLGRLDKNFLSRAKLLLEKPFGTDLHTARIYDSLISRYFKSGQVYRIDHYLAKEMAQNLIVFRQKNSLIRGTWNRRFIQKIEIIAAEAIGIEGRSDFYEQTGALRDVVQSHLLQLAALTLMDIPFGFDLKNVPRARLSALCRLSLDLKSSFRGQYRDYRREVNNPGSLVETFASLTLYSSAPKWINVPIILTTGKALDRKFTGIRLTYRQQEAGEANTLVFRLYPDEGIRLDLWAKKPGYQNQVVAHRMHFKYSEHYRRLPEAYERVLSDAINSDHTFFTSGEEVLASWKILDPLQKLWKSGHHPLIFYPRGSDPDTVLPSG